MINYEILHEFKGDALARIMNRKIFNGYRSDYPLHGFEW